MGKRVISRRRGSGTGRYRSPSHRHHGAIYHPAASVIGEAKVISILPAPGRSAPIAEVVHPEGGTIRILASAGLATGDTISLHEGRVDRGSILALGRIPDGTLVSNLEVKPFDGGRLVRTAGASALVVAHSGQEVTVQLPSGSFKQFLAHQHVGRPSTVSSGTWPGAKVGRFSRSTRKKRQRQQRGAV
jgi:large subunit ribosomal protein L2